MTPVTRLGYLQQVITLADQDPRVMEYLEAELLKVLQFARLCGHDVSDWNNPDDRL